MTWLLYLRKSRQDDQSETVEQVLAKHEAILQEYATREFGHAIAPENIYREVVSGENLSSRVEIKKVLTRIEDPDVEGVLVVEPSRLSRGDLADCSTIITAFRFSNTLIVTPVMTYDLSNKMERKFFQDELLRGNDYLEYTKEILARGRVAAVKRGAFIGQRAPYGMRRIKKGKDWTLEPGENVDIVKLIFAWYTEEMMTRREIADRLQEMGAQPPKGDKWHKDSVRYILANPHYIGLVRFYYTKLTPVMERGQLTKKHLKQYGDDVLIADGLHDPVIDMETWEKAQARFDPPRKRVGKISRNPLAGILRCGNCGQVLHYKPYYGKAADRYVCRHSPPCYRSIRLDDVMESLTYALENVELPNLQVKLKNGDGNARQIQERHVAKLEKQMEDYRAQEDTQYELLETKQYTPEVFARRNAALNEKIKECQAALYKAKAELPDVVNYEERIVALTDAIQTLKSPDATVDEKNRLLKAIVERVEYVGPPSDPANRSPRSQGKFPFTLKIKMRL